MQEGILVVVILVSARDYSISVHRLERATGSVYRLCRRRCVYGDCVGNVGIAALSMENGIMAASLQCLLSVLLSKPKDAVAAAEGLDRMRELFHHLFNENFGIRANLLCLCQKIRLIPVPVIAVFLGHIGRDHDPALGCVASVVGADEITVFMINIDLLSPGTDLQRLLQILAGHGIVDLVIGEGVCARLPRRKHYISSIDVSGFPPFSS